MLFLTSLGWFVLGLAFLSWAEYVHHWRGGHTGMFGKAMKRSHLGHHADPLEGGVTYAQKVKQRMGLVIPVVAVMTLVLVPAVGALVAAPFMLGVALGYFYSEWFHHAIHHRAPKNRFEVFMWRYHYVHHFVDSRLNIGFTTPIWDFVFRTARVAREVDVPTERVSLLAVSTVDGLRVVARSR